LKLHFLTLLLALPQLPGDLNNTLNYNGRKVFERRTS
jgi:hypothetical protein